MKKLIKNILISVAGLYLVAAVVPGIVVSGGIKPLLLAGVVLTVLNLLVRPLVNLLLLPINLMTMGMFRWLVNVAMLWLAAVFVAGFQIKAFDFSGWEYQGLVVPAMRLSVFWTTTLGAFLLNLLVSIAEWVFKD